MKNVIAKNISTDMLNGNNNTDGSEIKCGRLCLVQKQKGRTIRIQVFVRVYRSCFEHYLVLYRDQKYSLQSGYISLKNCRVDIDEDAKLPQIRVTLNDYEGTGVVFESATVQEADCWLQALQPQLLSSSPTSKIPLSPSLSPVIPRSPLMPTLEEETEESDEDCW